MKKLVVYVSVLLLLVSIVQAGVVSHSASQVTPGTFQTGDYTFDGKVNVTAGNDFCVEGGNCLSTAGSGTVGGTGAANSVAFWTGASTLSASSTNFTWDNASQKLGVGTSGPSYKLHVVDSDSNAVVIYADATATGATANTRGAEIYARGANSMGLYVDATDTSALGTNKGAEFWARGEHAQAVFGSATSTVGGANTYGGYFVASSDAGTAVYADSVNDSSGGQCTGGRFNSNCGAGHGVYATNGAQTGTSYGVRAEVNSDGLCYGVYGAAQAPNATGTGYGGYFTSASGAGYGAYGENTYGSTGLGETTYGGYFKTNADAGYGVYGYAAGSGGTGFQSYGGYFRNDDTSGLGVKGEATAGSGATYGVYGQVASTTGYSGYFTGGLGVKVAGNANVTGTVYGQSFYGQTVTAITSGATNAVWGQSIASDGRGGVFYGVPYGTVTQATSTTGVGLHSSVSQSTGRSYAIIAQNPSTTDLATGIYVNMTGTSGTTRGIEVVNPSTQVGAIGVKVTTGPSASQTFGVSATNPATGANSAAIYGHANATGASAVYGVYGISDATSGRGVYGIANAASGTTMGVFGQVASSTGYAGYFTGGYGLRIDATNFERSSVGDVFGCRDSGTAGSTCNAVCSYRGLACYAALDSDEGGGGRSYWQTTACGTACAAVANVGWIMCWCQ